MFWNYADENGIFGELLQMKIPVELRLLENLGLFDWDACLLSYNLKN
jgi:hypothetical protein